MNFPHRWDFFIHPWPVPSSSVPSFSIFYTPWSMSDSLLAEYFPSFERWIMNDPSRMMGDVAWMLMHLAIPHSLPNRGSLLQAKLVITMAMAFANADEVGNCIGIHWWLHFSTCTVWNVFALHGFCVHPMRIRGASHASLPFFPPLNLGNAMQSEFSAGSGLGLNAEEHVAFGWKSKPNFWTKTLFVYPNSLLQF